MALTVAVYAAFAVEDAVSKITLSEDVGTAAPLAQPEVVDQCAVSFQLPVPPTQKRSAILCLGY